MELYKEPLAYCLTTSHTGIHQFTFKLKSTKIKKNYKHFLNSVIMIAKYNFYVTIYHILGN